jgi:hypothetical protein
MSARKEVDTMKAITSFDTRHPLVTFFGLRRFLVAVAD